MGLPKIDLPIFETKLISTGRKKIKYRPFTVKEEKVLLIGQESNDIDQVILAIKQVIGNCCSDVNVDKLPMFDMEYLLLQIRGKSVNNVIDFTINDPETEKPVQIEMDIDDVKIQKSKEHNKNISIGEDAYLVMEYPTLEEVTKYADNNGNETAALDIMLSCIDSVVQGDTVYKLEDFDETEINEFLDSFSTQTLQDVKKFFDTMPVLKFETTYVNANDEVKKLVLEGTETFFI